MKILHTADWHLGTFRSPVKDGVNLRTEDTKRCLDELIRVANEEKPDYSLVSGDIFHVGRLWSDRCCEEIITAIHYIRELAAVSKQVVVMRGTPNHDGSGQFNVLSEMFADVQNVHVVITPQVISFDDVDIAVLPGFDRGVFRANHPGLSSDEENVVFTNELSNIVTGLKAQCSPEKKSILMAHYTVPGCNTESGQTMMLTQFEPIIIISGAISVLYGVFPAINTTLPYSPIHLAKAIVKPAMSAGRISGNITLKKIRVREAPNIAAASSYSFSTFSSTGCTLLTTNGIPIKTSATVIPIRVYAIFIPTFAKILPTHPSGIVRCVSAIPATAVGNANGSSIIPSIIFFPGKSYLTSTHAIIIPITAFISDAISAVMILTL